MANQKRKRQALAVSSGVDAWALLQEELSPRGRPDNSITAEEYAERTGYSYTQSGRKLRSNPKLRAVQYVAGGKRRACFVAV